MQERLTKNQILIPSITLIIITVLISAGEFQTVAHHPYLSFYFLGKSLILLLLLFSIVFTILEISWIFEWYPILFFINFVIYTSHGQFFRPNYWLAYIQFTSIYPILFTLRRFTLGFLLGLGLLIFDSVFYFTSKTSIANGTFSKELFNDIFIGTIISTVITFIGASIVGAEKSKSAGLYQRFIDLGKNMSSIAHDIKGMISGPCSYVEIIHSRLPELPLSENDARIIEFLKEDIYAIRDFVLEMNQLVSYHVTEKNTLVKISQSLKSVHQIFKSKIKNTKIDLIGDLTIYTKKDYINRILINSIINSCEAIQKNKIEHGKITIYCEDCLLGIADNSGEHLDKKTLSLLNSSQGIVSRKDQGSGLGILLIKDYVKMMGGKFKYTNHTQGVSLEIRFPRSICKPTVELETQFEKAK